MQTCPSCKKATFADGWCTYCGYSVKPAKPAQPAPRVVQGRAVSAAPLQLDPSALSPVELPLEALEVLEPEALPMEALEALPMEALQAVEEPEPLPAEAVGLVLGTIEPEDDGIEPMEGMEANIRPGVEVDVAPMEGLDTFAKGDFEVEAAPVDGLEINDIEPRTFKSKNTPASGPVEFSYAVCPGCNTEQPQPPPTFCETCGQRLRTKAKGKAGAEGGGAARGKKNDEDKVKCRECGVFNKHDASSCVNCGFKLAVNI